MARVVSHAIKQASLNLKDMVDKKSIGLEVDELTEIFSSGITTKVYNPEDHKPEVLQTTIDQIKAMFNVGTEVKGWTVTCHGPPSMSTKNGKKVFDSSEVRASPIEGIGARFVVVVGTREIANIAVSVGSTGAESTMMMLSGDCLYLKVTLCPVTSIYFNNTYSEKLPARKGFRETVVKKSPLNRYVLIFDGHIEMKDVISKVKTDLMDKVPGLEEKIPDLESI